MFGPPPLGPGAPGLERLVAFGAARIDYVLEYGELARAADESAYNRFDVPAAVLWHRHIELLLREEGMDADPRLMAMALSATLDPERLLHAVRVHGIEPGRLGRILAGTCHTGGARGVDYASGRAVVQSNQFHRIIHNDLIRGACVSAALPGFYVHPMW